MRTDPETTAASAPRTFIEMFGALHLSVDRRPAQIKSRKSRALLAYLALSPHRTESRVRLAGLLWSEKTDKDSRVSLRQQLMGVKHDIGGLATSLLQSDRANVWLDGGGAIASDIAEVLGALDHGDVPDILLERKSLMDQFLAGLDDLDPAFDYWLVIQRESLSEQLMRKLRALITPDAAPGLLYRSATAIHNLDPTNEEACRLLMQHHARNGDIPAALRVYSDLWDLLDKDFDMEPTQQTQQLVAEIKLTDNSAPQPPGAPGAVLPPAKPPANGDAGPVLILAERFHDEVLSEPNVRRINGLRHELIAALTRFRDWSVREAGATIDPAWLVGRKAYDITANAVEEGGEIFVSFMLRRHSDQEYLWSQRASINLDNWQGAKLKLIRSIATSLDIQISAERLSRIANVPDQSLDVYDRWLRGNELTYGWRPEEEMRAEAIFRSIIEEAPDFAPAYAGLVQILNTRHHIFPGVLRDHDREEEAIALARIAAKLDPMDTRTQLCLAWSQLLHQNFEQAVFYYDLALQMNENDPWTLTSCAQGLSYCGEKDRAHALADRAIEVASGGEPIHWSYQMCIRYLEGDYAAALSAAGRAENTAFFVNAWKAAALAELGQPAAARAAIAAFHRDVSQNWHGSTPPTPQTVLDWFMQCFPIRGPADRERLQASVLAAGLLEVGK